MAKPFPQPSISKGGFPAETSLETVPPEVRAEFRALYPLLQGWMQTDHNADGTHNRVRAVSITSAEGFQSFGRGVPDGVAVDIEWNPANFTINAAGSWDVRSADQLSLKAAMWGNLLFFSGDIISSNVTAPVGNELRIALPWNLAGVCHVPGSMFYEDAGGAHSVGEVFSLGPQAGIPVSYLVLRTSPIANWTATAGHDTAIQFSIVCPAISNPLL